MTKRRNLRNTVVTTLTSLALTLCVCVAQADADLAGYWVSQMNQDYQIREDGPDYISYYGLPINDEARAAALSYSADTVSELHRQCEPWPVTYLLMGPFGFQMSSTLDPTTGAIVAYHITGAVDRMPMTIWMDGRPHPPPQGLHTYEGFTTGKWVDDTLVTTTTHIKDGWLTRNGIPNSNQETVTMYYTRHGDLLTITAFINDPVYLSATYVQSRTWRIKVNVVHAELNDAVADALPLTQPPMTCSPEEEDPGISDGYHVATVLPGQNSLMDFNPKTYHIPLEAALGGVQTLYPEFRKRLQSKYTPPAQYCKANCCGTGTTQDFTRDVLACKAD